MNRKVPDEKTRREVREFFGITKDNWKCKPPPTNFVKSLVKISSLLPDQQNNPFSEYSQYANDPQYKLDSPNVNFAGMQNSAGPSQGLCKPFPGNFVENFIKSYYLLPNQEQNPFAGYEKDWPNVNFAGMQNSAGPSQDGVRDSSVPRRNEEASYVSKHSSGVEIGNSSLHSHSKSDGISDAFCKDGVLSEREMIIDESGMSKNSEGMVKIANGEKGTNGEAVEFCNVNQDLSSITRILMDESDDPEMLQLLDRDLNLDIAHDLGSILDLGRPNDKSLTTKSIETENITTGEITKKDLVDEKKKKGVEVTRSISQGSLWVSQAQKFVNQNVTCFKDARSKDTKLYEQNVPQEQTEIGGLTSTRRETENVGDILSGKFVDNSARRNRLVNSAKGKKPKVKNSTKMSKKNVGGKDNLVRVEDKTYNSMRFGDDDPMVQGKTLTQNALGISRDPSTKEDKENWTKSCERLRYTREQLLLLGKTAFVPEPIKKAVQEIGAEIHEKHQIAAAFKIADSCILKNKRRGSSSEARKEKKKMKRRKKRAELNRKLGVKRLKLQTIVKPKVVQHCRHYLQGRCHEGEKCKFSHDVVPLTKSKPCCHFARQSCMKGDDCPFDHQLTKYPCNSYVDTGFCNRGESCLFSHKVEVKEGSEPSAVTLKSDTISVDQHDILKSKQVDASVPFIFGKTTPNKLNETLAAQTTQPAQRPKGLSFISVQPKGLDFSQESSFSARSDVQPNVVLVGENSNLRKTLMNIPGSSTQQEIGPKIFTDFWTPTPSPELFPSLSTLTSNPDSAVKGPEIITGFPNLTLSPDKALKVSEMLSGAPTPAKQKGISVSSSNGPSYDISGGKAASIFSTKADNNIQSCFREKEVINVSKKSKEVQPEPRLWGFQTSSSQFSSKVDLPVKNPPSNFQSDYSIGVQTKNRAFNFSEKFSPVRPLEVSDMFNGVPTPTKAKGINVSSSNEPSYDLSGGKSAFFPTKRNTDMQTCFREKGNINASEKSKEVQSQPGVWSSQTTLSKFSTNVDLPAKNPPSNYENDYSIGVPTHTRAFNFSEVFKGIPSPTPSPDRSLKVPEMLSSSDGISGEKSSSVFSTKRDTDIDVSKKLKEVQPEHGLLSFQTSLSRFSTNVDLPVKTSPNNSQKALQSALAFAAKYQSKTKMSSMADTKGNNWNEGSSRSGSKQSEPLQASNILQFLNQGINSSPISSKSWLPAVTTTATATEQKLPPSQLAS